MAATWCCGNTGLHNCCFEPFTAGDVPLYLQGWNPSQGGFHSNGDVHSNAVPLRLLYRYYTSTCDLLRISLWNGGGKKSVKAEAYYVTQSGTFLCLLGLAVVSTTWVAVACEQPPKASWRNILHADQDVLYLDHVWSPLYWNEHLLGRKAIKKTRGLLSACTGSSVRVECVSEPKAR